MRRFTITAISLLLMGTLVACGDDDEASNTPPADNSEETGDTSDPAPIGEGDDDGDGDEEATGGTDEEAGEGGDDAAPAGGAGTVTANGETYGFNDVMNCEPPEAVVPDMENTLAVSALASDGIAVHVRVSMMGDRVFQDLDFYGPDGAYNGGANQVGDEWANAVDEMTPESPLTITDDQITGTVTVVNTRATDETFDIDVDIPFPTEVSSC